MLQIRSRLGTVALKLPRVSIQKKKKETAQQILMFTSNFFSMLIESKTFEKLKQKVLSRIEKLLSGKQFKENLFILSW